MFTEKDPKVSIITACFNSERYLERALASLYVQRYNNIEHIIVDGGSTDRTLAILDKYKDKIAKIISEPDNGIYDAMNKGIRYATGDILYFFNSDDRFYGPDVIRDAVEFFKRRKVNFVYGDIINDHADGAGYSLGRFPRFITKMYFLRNTIAHPTTFFHKECFKKAGCYDINYKICSDYEWYLRALVKHGFRGAHMGKIISIFQCGGASTNEANKNRILSERESAQNLYFSPIEAGIGRFINFFLYWDFVRVVARFMLKENGYRFLLRFKKKVIVHG